MAQSHESTASTTMLARLLHPAKDPLWSVSEGKAAADYERRIERLSDNTTSYGASSDTYHLADRDDNTQWIQITAIGKDAELDDVLVDVTDDTAIDDELDTIEFPSLG